jgi:hypothetical protein
VGGDTGSGRPPAEHAEQHAEQWRAATVRIEFPPDPLFNTTMRWTNRSTFQQVIEFTGHE